MASSKGEEAVTLKSVEEAMSQIETKRNNLKRAYDHLLSLSPSLLTSSSWSDLDTHFSFLHSSLSHRFNLLKHPHQQNPPGSLRSVSDQASPVVSGEIQTDPPPHPSEFGGSALSTVVSGENRNDPLLQDSDFGGSAQSTLGSAENRNDPPLQDSDFGGSVQSTVVTAENQNDPLSQASDFGGSVQSTVFSGENQNDPQFKVVDSGGSEHFTVVSSHEIESSLVESSKCSGSNDSMVVSGDVGKDPPLQFAQFGGSCESMVVPGQENDSRPPPSSQNGSSDESMVVSDEKEKDPPFNSAVNGDSVKSPVMSVLKGERLTLSSNGNVVAIPRSKLWTLCENMDGKGVGDYVKDNWRLRGLRVELLSALRAIPDRGSLVLDSVEGFYSMDPNSGADKDLELHRFRKGCLHLLDVLMEITRCVTVSCEARESEKAGFGVEREI